MELTIVSLASGGDGVGRAPDGRVVFVPFAAPGDRVRVRVTRETARYLRARVDALLEPGPSRVDPVCPVFGSCGGCSWQHVDLDTQLEAKRRIVLDALRRIGGLAFGGSVEVVPSPAAYGYRTRTRVLRRAGRTGYRRRRSNALVAVSRCPVLAPPLDASLHDLAASADAPDGEWEIAAAGGPARCVRLGGGEAAGAGAPLELRVGGDRLRVSPGVFFQSNAGLHEALAEAVVRAAGNGGSALELFAGAGFFTLALSRRFAALTAVESHPAAAADLAHNLERAGRDNVTLLAERLETAWPRLPAAEALVLDPPRTGLPPRAAARLADAGPERIVYLSCDPATLARDLSDFAAGGYRLREVRAFDLFPQTPHVEVLASLVHSGGAAGRSG